jgi:ribonucleoside-diphosphate reductase alpha chain
MFLDDSACNLASLNLIKFLRDDGTLDLEGYKHAIDIVISSQEFIVDNAGYPTPQIEENSRLFRPLGLGYANLGALLMAKGLPYDSEAGRSFAACVTSILCGEAYLQSAHIAKEIGPFKRFPINREPMLNVIKMHRDASYTINKTKVPEKLYSEAHTVWEKAYELGEKHGFRNAQATVLAPTGTIGFMMDCDTTGIEPDIALVKYKKLVGGGMLKIVNTTVPKALRQLGYIPEEIDEIVAFIDQNDTIEGAPHLKEEHFPVFDCAFKPKNGNRSIHYMGHLKMMSATQPFISGAISKTINMPQETAVMEIRKAYLESWKLGLKAVAIYRDGCKRTQPLNTTIGKMKNADGEMEVVRKPYRRRLPDERTAITHKFSIAGHEGYITVGLYPDGNPGEIFLTMAKEGSVVSGLMDGFATAISLALQYGVPLKVLVNKFAHTRFEPAGMTNNREIPIAKSITDYIFRWLASKFLSEEEKEAIGVINRDKKTTAHDLELAAQNGNQEDSALNKLEAFSFKAQDDAPPCHECGAIMVRNGACYKCLNCGATSGCS